MRYIMGVSLIFKIAAVGILVTILSQVLKHSGREEHAFLIGLAGLILVLSWIVPYIYELLNKYKDKNVVIFKSREDADKYINML